MAFITSSEPPSTRSLRVQGLGVLTLGCPLSKRLAIRRGSILRSCKDFEKSGGTRGGTQDASVPNLLGLGFRV